MKMQIRHHITDFDKEAFIIRIKNTKNPYPECIGSVYCWTDVEHCIIQALYDNDDTYYLNIKGQMINLLDKDIFHKVDEIYPKQMTYAMRSFTMIEKLRNKKITIDELKKYNQIYGTRFK